MEKWPLIGDSGSVVVGVVVEYRVCSAVKTAAK